MKSLSYTFQYLTLFYVIGCTLLIYVFTHFSFTTLLHYFLSLLAFLHTKGKKKDIVVFRFIIIIESIVVAYGIFWAP